MGSKQILQTWGLLFNKIFSNEKSIYEDKIDNTLEIYIHKIDTSVFKVGIIVVKSFTFIYSIQIKYIKFIYYLELLL